MNNIMKQLKEATYKNPIFAKTKYRNTDLIVAGVEVSTCEVEENKYYSYTCDKATFIIIDNLQSDYNVGSGIAWIYDKYEQENKWGIELLQSTNELLDKYKGALENRKYFVTFYDYPEYPELLDAESTYELYKKYFNEKPLNEFSVKVPDDIHTSNDLEKWVIENYPEYFYCMTWKNTVGDFCISPCSIGGLFEVYEPSQIATKSNRIKIAERYLE